MTLPAPTITAPVPAPLFDNSPLLQRALALQAQGDEQNAYRILVAAVTHERTNPAAWYRLGVALMGLKKWAASAACYRRANELYPGDCGTLTNLGWTLHKAGKHAEAARHLVAAIRVDETKPLAYTNLAQTWLTTGNADLALSQSDLAIKLGDEPIHKLSHAFSLFANENWEEGFKFYEARIPYRLPEYQTYPYPRWDGNNVQTLYIQAEQGLGDTIMALRWIGEAAVRCDRIVLFVHKELRRLVKETITSHSLRVEVEGDESDGDWDCEIEVNGMPAPLPQADAWCPIMSLPFSLGLTDFTFHSEPYIRCAPVEKGDKWNIGICWAGSAQHDHDEHRSMHLKDFMPFIDRLDTNVKSIQLGDAQKQIAELGLYGVIEDCSGNLSDMADTRDLIAELDMVLTCDTSVAHLAGAMGKRTFLFLNDRGTDWRWGRDAADTHWYPSIRIFRRALSEDWSAPVARALGEM